MNTQVLPATPTYGIPNHRKCIGIHDYQWCFWELQLENSSCFLPYYMNRNIMKFSVCWYQILAMVVEKMVRESERKVN